MILLAVCDVRYNFMLLDVGQYGLVNDSGALNYPVPEKIPGLQLGKVPFFLVGDEIFPLKDWLMHPYPGKKQGGLEELHHVFNYHLSRAR